MNTTLSQQILAIKEARRAKHEWDIDKELNDALSTLAAIKMLFSGGEDKIRAEFVKFSLGPSREPFTGADDFIDFLRLKGLNLDLIK